MKRRTFLEIAGLGLAEGILARAITPGRLKLWGNEVTPEAQEDSYGSGHFGVWERDAHGLPSYRYTCNQITDPKAVQPVDRAWRSPTDHMHQVGNDRLVAVVSNYGHVQVRQDEGGPKFLNDYCPEQNRYGGGLGFLADEDFVLSTYYTGAAESFDRFFGMGYLRKRVAAGKYSVDQVIFAPYGDDPVLISQVTITNRSTQTVHPRWVEYWGCSNYQFSYRALMESGVLGGEPNAVVRRRELAARFSHRFEPLKDMKGLLDRQTFRGRSPEEKQAWQRTQASLEAKPTGFFGGVTPPVATGTGMEDLSPPATFLASLDAPVDGYATDANRFFQDGIDQPKGMTEPPPRDLNAQGMESAFLLERRLTLRPGESRTLYFAYGYVPEGFSADALVSKYAVDPASLWSRSSAQWKATPAFFRTEEHPWIEREARWSSYYLRSGLSYDSFFREHILSQGAGYQYLAGLQGAARDPLQHALPLVFTAPELVREILRYTLKEIQPDGSIPYGIVGSGVPMPCVYRPSDLQLWILWLASEYVLATRDRGFLSERIPPYPRQATQANDPTVLDLLHQAFTYLTKNIGTGEHGLQRLLNGDWNDSIVYTHLTPEQQAMTLKEGESVLNAAMSTYVFDYYADLLNFVKDDKTAEQARAKAKEQRRALEGQWYNGQWYRRAYLSKESGWVGEKQMWLEPQPWALIGRCVPADRINSFVKTVDRLMRKPSPIGAMLQSQPDPTMKDEPGTGTNGGIFAAINGTLVWALSLVDGEMAWDEWMKNTLARHAQTYPDMWFGIWSGPDAYHSIFSKYPGGTGPDFPVLNMHSHAWPLYSLVKLLGTEFVPDGVRFKPMIPLGAYEFHTQLMGFKRTSVGYSGWYAPAGRDRWTIEIVLPQDELGSLKTLRVNGQPQDLHVVNGAIRFSGIGEESGRLRWEIA